MSISMYNLIELLKVKDKVRSKNSREGKIYITWEAWIIRLFYDGSETLCTWRLPGQHRQHYEGLCDITVLKNNQLGHIHSMLDGPKLEH